uniref:Secreted protein n=1 Tax=Aegilops tauschii TaxID=37682 RepID=R7WGH7_AEGTA
MVLIWLAAGATPAGRWRCTGGSGACCRRKRKQGRPRLGLGEAGELRNERDAGMDAGGWIRPSPGWAWCKTAARELRPSMAVPGT